MGTQQASKRAARRHSLATYIGPVALAVVVFAGQLKNNPLLSWLPVDLTLLAAALAATAAILRRVHVGPENGRIWPALALWTVFLLGVAAASFDEYSATKIAILFSVTLVLALAPNQLLVTSNQRRIFLLTLVAIGVFVGASLLLWGDPSTVDSSVRAVGDNRILIEGSDTIGTAQMAGAAALICLLIALVARQRLAVRALMVSAGGVLTYLAVATGSRGPVFAIGLAVLIVAISAPRLQRARGRTLVIASLAAIAAISYAIRSDSYGLDRITSLLTGQVDASAAQRQYFWSLSFDQFATNPFGIGWGDFGDLTWMARYPHNMLIEATLEGGWLAGLGTAAVVIVTLVVLRKNATSTQGVIFLGLAAFATFNAMVSSDINGNRLLWVAIGYGLTLLPSRPQLSDSAPDSTVRSRLLDVKG